MVQGQDIDLTVIDSQVWTATDQKIAQIKNIFEEEGVANDPDLMSAFDEAVKASVKGEIIDQEV